MCHFGNTEEEEDTLSSSRLVVREAFPGKAAFNQNPTAFGAVCQMYGSK